MTGDLRAALARASLVGAYFESASITEQSIREQSITSGVAAGWRPLRDLVTDPAALADRVAFARDFLSRRTGADIEQRACASINSLGVVSRLVAPALATACLDGLVARVDLDTAHWRAQDGGPLPVAFTVTTGRGVATADEAAAAIVELVIEPAARPVLEAYRDRFALSPKTLWGNLASALHGAAGMLAGSGTVIDPVDVVAALLAEGPLAGAGRYEPFAGRRFFVRHNCCLFYRVPAGGKCADCVLVPDVARHELWRTAVGQ